MSSPIISKQLFFFGAQLHLVMNSQKAVLHAFVKSKGFKTSNLSKFKLLDVEFVAICIVQLESITKGLNNSRNCSKRNHFI
jgi:hypothetical protein